MPLKPICFVIMPFGKKEIDFDVIFETAIRPAIEDAGMEAKRADHDGLGGIAQQRILDDMLLCDFVVADLTIPNPKVNYSLGVRQAVRPNTTLVIAADRADIPFEIGNVRAIRYGTSAEQAAALRKSLGDRLKELRESAGNADQAVYQLVKGSQGSNLPPTTQLQRIQQADTSLFELLNRYSGHEKTDVFRDAVTYSDKWRAELESARKGRDRSRLNAIRDELRPFEAVEAGVIIDLYLSYRAVGAFAEMLALSEEMPEILKRTVMVREQRAFALNRLAAKEKRPEYREEAIRILEEITRQIGPNSETGGLLGRIYKDLWTEAGSGTEAEGFLRKAIDAYTAGFEADSRDAFPGINAVTLLELAGSPEDLAKKDKMLPVVRYAVELRLKGSPDYWDYATLLEIAVLEGNEESARQRLADALALVRENWEPETTARNLKLIREAREKRGQSPEWAQEIEAALLKRAKG